MTRLTRLTRRGAGSPSAEEIGYSGAMYGDRLARWDKLAEWPLAVAALLFFTAYALQIIGRPEGTPGTVAELVIWVT